MVARWFGNRPFTAITGVRIPVGTPENKAARLVRAVLFSGIPTQGELDSPACGKWRRLPFGIIRSGGQHDASDCVRTSRSARVRSGARICGADIGGADNIQVGRPQNAPA